MVGNENFLNGHTVRGYYSQQSYPFFGSPFLVLSHAESDGKLEVARFWSRSLVEAFWWRLLLEAFDSNF